MASGNYVLPYKGNDDDWPDGIGTGKPTDPGGLNVLPECIFSVSIPIAPCQNAPLGGFTADTMILLYASQATPYISVDFYNSGNVLEAQRVFFREQPPAPPWGCGSNQELRTTAFLAEASCFDTHFTRILAGGGNTWLYQIFYDAT